MRFNFWLDHRIWALVAIVVSSACSGTTPYSGAPSPSLKGANRASSWIDAKNPPTLFVSDNTKGVVFGYSQKTGKQTEELSGLQTPTGLAVDGKGNLYVVVEGQNMVYVYAPGATEPFLKLNGPPGPDFDVAVSRTGEVAVPSNAINGSMYIFKQGSSTPCNTIAAPTPQSFLAFAVYDSKGNIYVSWGTEGSSHASLGKVVGGCKAKSITAFKLQSSAPYVSSLAIDNSNHLLACCSRVESSDGSTQLYVYQLPKPSSATIISLTANAYSFPTSEMALTKSENSIYLANSPAGYEAGGAYRFKYPTGGETTQAITLPGVDHTVGIAVSPAAKL